MNTVSVTPLHERYTDLSDRFRSLWTFYQFLGGLFKYRNMGPLPFEYDFQGFHQKLQELVPQLSVAPSMETVRIMDSMERELGTVHERLREIEGEFPPSLLRRLFDHLKRQDEKILFALVKFYLQYGEFDADTLDKLDILLTRLGEAPQENGRIAARDRDEMQQLYRRLAKFARLPEGEPMEVSALVTAVREFRSQVEAMTRFDDILGSDIYDRYRELKHSLGNTFLQPDLLVEIVVTNIAAKKRFHQLYQEEEARILEDTNRIFEIERYLEKNPDVGHDALREQIETFRKFRSRFDAGRKENNLKRDDILELRRAMQAILERIGPLGDGVAVALASPVSVPAVTTEPQTAPRERPDISAPVTTPEPPNPPLRAVAAAPPPPAGVPAETMEEIELEDSTATLTEILPPDPMLNEALHKIMFALELAAWDALPEQAVHAKELHNLRLEPWEVEAYRRLSEGTVAPNTLDWELERFYLTTSALRVKMDEEASEIERLQASQDADRLFGFLERSAQSLERARDVDRRFRWFIEDMLYRGKTEGLEQIQRSHFRFLQSFATLWLRHESAGGITPL
ncbi:MAG: hypothetical protein GXP47_09960 [Acidobacteria bacterium]|nr:hypothetical protein [Acidobacteriota bacterium]